MNINRIISDAYQAAAKEVFDASEGKQFLHSTDFFVSIKVAGRGDFPFDQLRRWPSYPSHTGAAANLVTPSYKETDNREVDLTLSFGSQQETSLQQCAARYASFGWHIVDCTVHPQ